MVLFDGPQLKHAFSGSGGKQPRPEEPQGLLDVFKAAAVSIRGPAVCQRLNETLKKLMEQHSDHGVARDVKTHFALQAITTNVTNMREAIQKGGAEGYAKMQEAGHYLVRLQKLGLNA